MSSGIAHDQHDRGHREQQGTMGMLAAQDTQTGGPRLYLVAWLVIALCSLAAILPLLVRGPSCGHDFDFHLLSWMETAHDWHHHLFTPGWLATANYGAGEPRFMFYPPASWLLGALVGAAAGLLAGQPAGWTIAPVLFTFIAIFSSGICVYLLAQKFASRWAALAAACLFIANPYLLFVAYERTAYGELLSTPLIALLLLFALRSSLPILPLAIVIAGLWLTNAPAAVMGCYTLAFICLLRLAGERHWRNALKASASCALGLALAGVYLVPAVWQQRWVQIHRAVDQGMRVQDSFLFHFIGQGYHDQVLRIASILTVVVLGAGLVALALVLSRRSGRAEPAAATFGWLLITILLLQFPFSLRIWQAAPHLQFLQFPWRWLLVASVVAACLAAMAWSPLAGASQTRARGRVRGALAGSVVLLVVVCSIWFCARSFYLPCDEQDLPAGQLATFHNGAGVQGTDEYTAIGADNSAIFQDLPQVRLLTLPDAEEPEPAAGDNPEWPGYSLGAIDSTPGTIAIHAWEPQAKQLTVTTTRDAYAVLALMDYPSWRVSVNGQSVTDRPKREDGLMAIPIAAGQSSIAVQWTTTRDIVWGRALSAVALFLLLVLWRTQRTSAA